MLDRHAHIQRDRHFDGPRPLSKAQRAEALEEIVEECLDGRGPLDLGSVIDHGDSERIAMLFLQQQRAWNNRDKLVEAREDAEKYLTELARAYAQTHEELIDQRAYDNLDAEVEA